VRICARCLGCVAIWANFQQQFLIFEGLSQHVAQSARPQSEIKPDMFKPVLTLFHVILALLGCTESVSRDTPSRILVMGDSLFAVHGMSGQSVANGVERVLKEQVVDRAVSGARFVYRLPVSGAAGLSIPKQYRAKDWDWVVLNGGGNDIWFGCGCGRCNRKMDQLISKDGRRGVIPGFVSRMRASGAQVIYVGYMRTPGVTSPIEGCANEGDEMDRRAARLAALDRGDRPSLAKA